MACQQEPSSPLQYEPLAGEQIAGTSWRVMKARNLLAVLCTVLLTILSVTIVAGQSSYIVQPGDTLSAIARRFGVSVQAIAAANNIVNPNLIFAGTTLVIPDGSEPSVDAGSPPAPVPNPTAAPVPAAGGSSYVVRPGDTLYRVAALHGVTVQALIQANGISNPNLIYAGQELAIPGSAAPAASPPAPVVSAPTAPPAPAPVPTTPPPPAPLAGVNLLPNPSFEGGYYNLYGAPELQVPQGWSMEIDEGTSAPGTGATLLRPESRIVPRWGLPPHEQNLFVWNGDWSIKVFKGGAPMGFRLYTDLPLQPGTYGFRAGYFPDLVAGYDAGGQKVWAGEAAAGEIAFILTGGGSGWSTVTPGARSVLEQTFTIASPGTVRVGVAFRTRYPIANNGFFIDDWSLQRIGD